jgi:hypothetical protein
MNLKVRTPLCRVRMFGNVNRRDHLHEFKKGISYSFEYAVKENFE